MKGIVFTEFLEMVEKKFSPELADRIIVDSKLATDGAYTSVGTYDHQELMQLVARLGETTGIPVPDLVRTFGQHLFGRFVERYPQLFVGLKSTFRFLEGIEGYIHVEVRKLYPDAELPRFDCDTSQPGRLELTYRSDRPFADLAEGLMRGCIEHFGEPLELRREDLSAGRGTSARFILSRRG